MRTFDHFPKKDVCPICGKNADAPCFLLPVDGTQKGNFCEALPTHVACMTKNLPAFWYRKEVGIIYMRLPNHVNEEAK